MRTVAEGAYLDSSRPTALAVLGRLAAIDHCSAGGRAGTTTADRQSGFRRGLLQGSWQHAVVVASPDWYAMLCRLRPLPAAAAAAAAGERATLSRWGQTAGHGEVVVENGNQLAQGGGDGWE
jgi:hypothetical protein